MLHILTINTTHSKSIRDLSFSPHGKILAVCGFDKEISLYIYEQSDKLNNDDRHIYTLDGPAAEIKHIEFNDKGDKIVVCCRDGSIWMYQFDVQYEHLNILEIKTQFLLKEPECIAIMEQAHDGDIKCILFLNEYETISVGFEEKIKIHTENDCEFEQKVYYEYDEMIKSTLWSIEYIHTDEDYKYFIVAHANGVISFMKYNYKEYWFKLVTYMKVHTRDVYDLAYIFDQEKGELIIISVGGDNCLKISRINTIYDANCKIIIENSIDNQDYELNSVVTARVDERNIIVCAGDDRVVKYLYLD